MLHAEFQDECGNIKQEFSCDEDIILEMTFLVRQKVPGIWGYFYFCKASDESTVWVSDSNDVVKNKLETLPLGESKVRVRFPKRMLAGGEYIAGLNFTSYQNMAGFNVESPGLFAKIAVHDYATDRGDTRLGSFSTLLEWEFVR